MKFDHTCAGCGAGYFRAQAWLHSKCVDNAAVDNAVVVSSVDNAPKSSYERVKAWRKRHPEKYREQMRKLRSARVV